jgi:hypothetical protein
VASTALGLTWSPRTALSTGGGLPQGIARLNSTSVVATYWQNDVSRHDIDVRRSTTEGTSWEAPKTLSTDGNEAAIAALDPFVDVVWTQTDRIRYARSIDSGVTYGSSTAISPKGSNAQNPSVARGPGGIVVIAWQNSNTEAIKVRVSTDDGANFGITTSFATTANNQGTAVAAGQGVVYLAYKSAYGVLKVTRSTNDGATWDTPATVTVEATTLLDEFSLTAAANHVYLLYADVNTSVGVGGTIRYRRSLDSGATWRSARQISASDWKTAQPAADLYNGVLYLVYQRHVPAKWRVYFQKSTDGLHWTTPEVVDLNGVTPEVAYAGTVVVLFGGGKDVQVRTGS